MGLCPVPLEPELTAAAFATPLASADELLAEVSCAAVAGPEMWLSFADGGPLAERSVSVNCAACGPFKSEVAPVGTSEPSLGTTGELARLGAVAASVVSAGAPAMLFAPLSPLVPSDAGEVASAGPAEAVALLPAASLNPASKPPPEFASADSAAPVSSCAWVSRISCAGFPVEAVVPTPPAPAAHGKGPAERSILGSSASNSNFEIGLPFFT